MRRTILIFALVCTLGALLYSQETDPVGISIQKSLLKASPGEKFRVVLHVAVKKPWHINSNKPHEDYLIPTTVSIGGKGIAIVGVEYPPAHDVKFDFSENPVSVYQGEVDIILSLRLDDTVSLTHHLATVQLDYQACNNVSCQAPKTVSTSLTVEVVRASRQKADKAPSGISTRGPGSSRSDSVNVATSALQPPDSNSKVSSGSPSSGGGTMAGDIESRGLFVTFVLIFLGGLALNLTPCVYPLIPITIGYFGGQSQGESRKLLLLGVFYVLGMALTYSVVGVVTALSGALFGALLQNVYVVLSISALFVVLALSQFGVYEFNLPSSWMSFAGGARSGGFGAFFMGLTMGIVAAPCIGPFVLGLVTYVAAKGDPVQGFLMFFVLALGLGVPYLFLALFSGKIKQLPRSGAWMEGVKHLFGYLMLGMALYFVTPLLPEKIQPFPLPLFGILSAAVFLLVDKNGNSARGFFATKVVLSLAAVGISATMLAPKSELSPEWRSYSTTAYENSAAKGEPMLIDFYADWCIPCKELDAKTFSNRQVIDASQRFTSFKADMTKSESAATESLATRFQVKGVPTVLIIDSHGIEQSRITGYVDAAEFLRAMNSAR